MKGNLLIAVRWKQLVSGNQPVVPKVNGRHRNPPEVTGIFLELARILERNFY
jgi:hypothetical protein